MAYGTAIRQGLRLAGKIDSKYNINKIFVQKYVPPGYRKRVSQVFDVAGTLGGGYGIYNLIQSLYAPDTPGNDAQIPFQGPRITSRKSYKTRNRYPVCNNSRYRSRPRYDYRKRPSRFS